MIVGNIDRTPCAFQNQINVDVVPVFSERDAAPAKHRVCCTRHGLHGAGFGGGVQARRLALTAILLLLRLPLPRFLFEQLSFLVLACSMNHRVRVERQGPVHLLGVLPLL